MTESCRRSRIMFKLSAAGGFLVLAALAMAVALPTSAEAVANSCNGSFQLNYVSPTPNFPDINSPVRVELTLGAGTINGGTTLTMTAVRLDMACKQGGSLIRGHFVCFLGAQN